jgi:tRNA (Thr-GGU) A37 N-methylase
VGVRGRWLDLHGNDMPDETQMLGIKPCVPAFDVLQTAREG